MTNYLDADRIPVRLLLVLLMLVSLVMSATLPDAFGRLGLLVGAAYATMQVGRTAFVMVALRGERLQRAFQRVLVWCLVSGGLAILGGVVNGHARELLWLLTVSVDLLGAAVGYYTPWLGRSTTADWTIAGSHLAERCQGFILIALGESIVIIGATLASLPSLAAPEIIAFVTAFTGAVALWWIYFDRSADESERGIASFNRSGSTRPLRLSLRPPRHGRRDHRDGRRRRAGSLPPGQRGSRLDRLDDSWRDGSLFGWARGVQADGLARDLVD